MVRSVFTTIILLFTLSSFLYGKDFRSLYDEGKFTESLDMIDKELRDFYSNRVRDKLAPGRFNSIGKIGEKENLLKLYRNRKAKSFFIELNPRIAELHYYRGLNFYKQKSYREALDNFTQSLRFTKLKYGRDDRVFYMIAKVFKSMLSPETMQYERGYLDALEQAVSLNRENLPYSRELGLALSTTREKRKAAFYLERYLRGRGNSNDRKILLTLAGLYEALGKYLEAVRVYREFLRIEPENVQVLFSLGYLAYYRTGNFALAKSCFRKVLSHRKMQGDGGNLDLKAKCNEFLGDMNLSDRRFSSAEKNYLNAIALQKKKYKMILNIEGALEEKNREIDKLKRELIYNSEFNQFEEYEALKDERGRLETRLMTLKNEYKRLHAGKVNWNLAEVYIKKENYRRAIVFFRECLRHNYKTNSARDFITKLKLKIKRGY